MKSRRLVVETVGNRVHRAIRDGLLPHPRGLRCADCNGLATEYDHRDYNKPLSVEPVCHRCNGLRGPAIPNVGFFAERFRSGYPPYRPRHAMVRIFDLLDIAVDLSHVPRMTKLEHWEPFKQTLLDWEKRPELRPAPEQTQEAIGA